jgi:hypothetical protein
MMGKLNYDKYAIVTGGHDNNRYDPQNKKIELTCNDTYEGLPEKMIKLYEYILNNTNFNTITYVCKLDEDMILKKLLDTDILSSDYYGLVSYQAGSRRWHLAKCSPSSKFNTTEYTGRFVPWCLGGCGYILSKKILKLLKGDTDYENEIYEDLYVAKILNRHNVYPQQLKNMSDFWVSPTHKIG